MVLGICSVLLIVIVIIENGGSKNGRIDEVIERCWGGGGDE